jgi:lipopolysaccharide export system ATP-binding protein
MPSLHARHLAKSYKKRKVVIDVSITVESGHIVGLLGPNGAGKTTCFYMIAGLVPADNGNVLIDDRDITQLPIHGRARAGIGYLPQEASIFRKLTVADNIMAILETRKDLDRTQRQEKLESLLNEYHPYPRQLGYGALGWRTPPGGNRPRASDRPQIYFAR